MNGSIRKMRTKYAADKPVEYELPLGDQVVPMNELIGKNIEFSFTGKINCIACDRSIKKTYSGGFCFPCSQKLACADMCIVKPELCHYHKGTCREPKWGEENCLISHTVYLANSSGLKVGITRSFQKLTRWMDQGAIEAVALATVEARRDAGTLEVILKDHVADKTNWRKMLKNETTPIDLEEKREELLAWLPEEFEWEESDDEPVRLIYPVQRYPEKIKSHNFDKSPQLGGVLTGIKGQYLMFGDTVVNMRKYAGYTLELKG